jgi:futalosine hydrolase
MPFRILYVTASKKEADTLINMPGLLSVDEAYHLGDLEINLLITGVGSVSTAWALKQWISLNGTPDLAINGGIAGSYKDEILPGDVVLPFSDCFADSGIEDGDNFLTLSEAGLTDANDFPFKDGMIYTDPQYFKRLNGMLKSVRAITVNTATGSENTRRKLLAKFNPDIETMEGATFFYICSLENIPFLALRSISNIVERRNKINWKIDLALNNLSEKLKEVLLTLK